ncbi:hypothetical protein PENSPDRAFT_739954 [Peniophora sp. CONT]|nr:hypothetical protein PENSPDRAFT_739954 [Peniophora sp. CONT]
MASIGIMDLKSDILFEFFNLVAATDAPHALPWAEPGPLRYHLGWIRLAHVCRLWRTLLIDEMPSLWAQVVCNLPSHTHDTVLERAQTQPLSLALNIDDTFGDGSNHIPSDQRLPSEHTLRFHLRDFGVANVTRARNFRAGSFGYDWLPVFKGVHLPHLNRVDLHQERRYGDKTPVALLLPLDAPNLTSVKLHHIAATFTSTSIRGLTIHGTSMFCTREWSLLEVLRSLKQLEYLELEMRPSKMVDWNSQATSPIELASLKHIHVYGDEQANITALIELLETPSPLEEHTYYVHIEPEGWERFVRVLGPMLRQKAFNALFFADDDSQIVASTFVAVDKPEDYPGSAVQEVTLEVEHGSDNERVKAISAAMLAHIDGARIEQIIFGYKIPDEKVGNARNALRGFHAVTSFAALTHDTLKVLRASDDGHLFPNLSLLVATIEKRYDPDAERLWDLDSLRAWWDLLCTVLEDRIRAGVPIPRIRLASNASPITPTDALREVEVEGLVKVLSLVPEVEDTRKVFETT